MTDNCCGPRLLLTPVLVSLDYQETATTDQSEKASSVTETAQQIQAEDEEEEEEEGKGPDETTEENRRGSNWEMREQKVEGKIWEREGVL